MLDSAPNPRPASQRAEPRTHRRVRARRRSGMVTIEAVLVMALIVVGVIAAFKVSGPVYTDAAEHTVSSLMAAIDGAGVNPPRPPAWAPPAPEPVPPQGPEPESDDGGGFLGWVGDAAETVGGVAYELSPLSDLATLFDPNASLLDKGIAALSLLPGPGQAVKWAAKGVKFANKAADSAKATDKVKDGRKADDADEASDPLAAGRKKSDQDGENPDAPSCTGAACRNGTCFAAGTPVHTEDGLRPIEDVREGDLLWSRSDQTGELSLQRVLHRFVTLDRVLLRIQLDAGEGAIEELRVTPPHPFWTRRGWVAARDLTLEDEVTLLSGEPAPVIAMEALGGGETVYNFEVEQFHTYFVGEAGAWVHNQGQDECPDAREIERARNERNPNGLLSQPLPKFLSRHIRNAYEDIRAGGGTPRMTRDPNTGLPRQEVYGGRENRPWAGALEYEVPGQNGARVLVMKDANGNITKMGWVNPNEANEASARGRERNKYDFIHTFEAPHYPDSGWQRRGRR
jgi:hypothetical protein